MIYSTKTNIPFQHLLFAIVLLTLIGSGNLFAQNCVLFPPTNVHVSDITCNSATLSWASNTRSNFKVSYKLETSNQWAPDIKVGSDTFYLFTGLLSDTKYNFRLIASCPDGSNSPKIKVDATTLAKCITPPNIILILIDDSRFDYFSVNGAPSFYKSPNIDRIANEGVNFKRCLEPTSLCSPSRSTIATGLFTLKTGINYNGELLDTSFVTVPEVLGPHGYYTAIIGKDHGQFLNGKIPEFDFYMISKKFDGNDGMRFDYNGKNKNIDKAYILTVTDTAIGLIQRTTQPLFLWLAYQVPHFPSMILPSNEGKFDNGKPIKFGPDTAKYLVNYPSFLYQTQDFNLLHGEALDSTYRDVLEEMVGLDSCVGEILKTLQNTGKLDNTLIIFTSDNGYCLGNHWLNNKTFAYEPSIKIPLFVRYPKWFPGGTNIYNQFASNMDFAETMYDAAGITAGLPQMDGVSLKKLYDGTASRNSMYYLKEHNSGRSPTVRAFRDQYYKYIFHACSSDTVVEFFDEVNDSLELTNLVNNHAYASIIAKYAVKYDSMKRAWGDTGKTLIKNCYIKNPYVLKYLLDEDDPPLQPVIYPDLTAGTVEIYIPWQSAEVRLYDNMGRNLGYWKISDSLTKIDLPSLTNGMYYLQFFSGGKSVTKKLLIQ